MSVKHPKFSIRQTEDEEAIQKLQKKIMPSDRWYSTPNRVKYWLAYDGNRKPVGFCILTLLDHGIAFLSLSGVLVSARGNGLQTRMIRAREKYARKEGYSQIITYTKLHNIGSSHNLQKLGYMLYSPEERYGDDGPDEEPALYWMKTLT